MKRFLDLGMLSLLAAVGVGCASDPALPRDPTGLTQHAKDAPTAAEVSAVQAVNQPARPYVDVVPLSAWGKGRYIVITAAVVPHGLTEQQVSEALFVLATSPTWLHIRDGDRFWEAHTVYIHPGHYGPPPHWPLGDGRMLTRMTFWLEYDIVDANVEFASYQGGCNIVGTSMPIAAPRASPASR